MARARLDRFPQRSGLEYDCFWTATHFFDGASPPDSAADFPDNDGIARWVERGYREVPMAEARFGDLIALRATDGRIAHTANLVAGDVVFTKNGLVLTQPWVLARLADVSRLYPFTMPRAYRRR